MTNVKNLVGALWLIAIVPGCGPMTDAGGTDAPASSNGLIADDSTGDSLLATITPIHTPIGSS